MIASWVIFFKSLFNCKYNLFIFLFTDFDIAKKNIIRKVIESFKMEKNSILISSNSL
jgi:hypothetical protein